MVYWLVGFALLLTLAVSYYGSLEITRIPYFAVPYTPKDFGWAYEDLAFQSHDGLKLTGWFIPSPKPSAATLIVLHGIGSNHGDMLPNASCLIREGRWNIFMFNFRGHADSEGTCTSLGPLELRDLKQAVRFIRKAKPEATRHLGIFGHSMGAAVGLIGAAQIPEIEAVAAESPFASISQTVRLFARIYHGIPYYPFVPLAMWMTGLRLSLRMGRFSPVKAIGRIAPRPIYLIQGGRDLRIPMSDFQILWEAAREPKEQWIVPGADHGDPLLIDKATYEKRLVEFFRKAIP